MLSAIGVINPQPEAAEDKRMSLETPTIIVAHGAWADGSSWKAVIEPLQAAGIKVMAAPLPLTSVADDIAALERIIHRAVGPVILAAHAYAGAVISSVDHERIKGLAFIAALTPDEGETVADLFYREAPHNESPQLMPDADGFVWLPEQAFGAVFAQNATAEQSLLLAAVQRPINVACIQSASRKPAWRSKPSWYLVAEDDRMINPRTQLFMAERMGANIRSEKVDHLPLLTAPAFVVETILSAARSPAN
jgi:pimeloyl-ACP methyl ester carboxylesterase